MEVNPAQVRQSYRERIEDYTDRFRRLCSEIHIDFEEIDTMKPFDFALLAYLNKRKRLG